MLEQHVNGLRLIVPGGEVQRRVTILAPSLERLHHPRSFELEQHAQHERAAETRGDVEQREILPVGEP